MTSEKRPPAASRCRQSNAPWLAEPEQLDQESVNKGISETMKQATHTPVATAPLAYIACSLLPSTTPTPSNSPLTVRRQYVTCTSNTTPLATPFASGNVDASSLEDATAWHEKASTLLTQHAQLLAPTSLELEQRKPNTPNTCTHNNDGDVGNQTACCGSMTTDVPHSNLHIRPPEHQHKQQSPHSSTYKAEHSILNSDRAAMHAGNCKNSASVNSSSLQCSGSAEALHVSGSSCKGSDETVIDMHEHLTADSSASRSKRHTHKSTMRSSVSSSSKQTSSLPLIPMEGRRSSITTSMFESQLQDSSSERSNRTARDLQQLPQDSTKQMVSLNESVKGQRLRNDDESAASNGAKLRVLMQRDAAVAQRDAAVAEAAELRVQLAMKSADYANVTAELRNCRRMLIMHSSELQKTPVQKKLLAQQQQQQRVGW